MISLDPTKWPHPLPPRLPWVPESCDQLKARFQAALVPDFDIARCLKGEVLPQGASRRHVFDFQNGVRMIASLDNENSLRLIHLSFGIVPGVPPAIKHGEDFKRFAREIGKEFVGPRKIKEQFGTGRAYHIFYEP